MTNHHVGADMLQKISTAGKNYHKEGFLAKTRADEIKAPDLELNVLVDIKDVTDRVLAAVKPGMGDSEAGTAKRKAMATIEKESLDASGLRSDVVTLYQGGRIAFTRIRSTPTSASSSPPSSRSPSSAATRTTSSFPGTTSTSASSALRE